MAQKTMRKRGSGKGKAASRKMTVTMKGQPVTLTGTEVKEGQKAPNFKALKTDLSEFDFKSACKDKVCVIAAVPSLDTSVCNVEARRFDQEAGALEDKGEVIVISEDLPFAQKRWAETAGVHKIKTVSDHRATQFGKLYGILMKNERLLARTVFVVDKQGKVRYRQIVEEQTNEPDYDKALEVAKSLL